MSDTRREELEKIYEKLLRAYCDGQGELLRLWTPKLSDMVVDVPDEELVLLERGLCHAVVSVVMAEEGKPLPNPLDEVSLAKYLETERALLCLYGDVNSRRKSYGHVYATLEAGYYRRLRRLREIFKTSGHPDLVACVERFISEWVEQVESPNGYTRILAEYYLAIEKETAYMAMIDNDIDWQSCIRGVVVSSAGFLVRAGYTPKWLSEIERTPEPKVWPVYD